MEAPDNPMELFQKFINIMREENDSSTITMSLATINKEFGVLNRTVLFRGLSKRSGNITFVTERNSQKYKDLQENPKVSVVLLFLKEINGKLQYRQIRVHGSAIELSEDEIAERWKEEPVFARIRSKMASCGAPVKWDVLKEKHDQLLEAYKNGEEPLNQSETYTSFEIIADSIDFYYAEHEAIGDRVIYRRHENDIWTHEHVFA
ncbi:pyridoxine/pyridoxamine 5'-phosphate oxidase isoform X2 [Condylostylus longicornis]|uniref:pyridoxine/pyridoxamine 5'-phosphate oxidase isoform X2 n=1 Tax=Condylostylus longicornis TaxID=2530218 RepID=UPI00244E1A3D|nr:pyridoxine/pyridoxamine 5'-phosphate oxidase isoform X2 [Condylostylus longicornis]